MSVSDLDARSQAVVHLARGATTDKAGELVGVSGRTVRRWREDPEFEAEIDAARKAILAEAVGALTAAVVDAVATLHAALTDPSAVIRVRAAGEILKALPALASHAELEARIAALEAAAQNNTPEVPRVA